MNSETPMQIIDLLKTDGKIVLDAALLKEYGFTVADFGEILAFAGYPETKDGKPRGKTDETEYGKVMDGDTRYVLTQTEKGVEILRVTEAVQVEAYDEDDNQLLLLFMKRKGGNPEFHLDKKRVPAKTKTVTGRDDKTIIDIAKHVLTDDMGITDEKLEQMVLPDSYTITKKQDAPEPSENLGGMLTTRELRVVSVRFSGNLEGQLFCNREPKNGYIWSFRPQVIGEEQKQALLESSEALREEFMERYK